MAATGPPAPQIAWIPRVTHTRVHSHGSLRLERLIAVNTGPRTCPGTLACLACSAFVALTSNAPPGWPTGRSTERRETSLRVAGRNPVPPCPADPPLIWGSAFAQDRRGGLPANPYIRRAGGRMGICWRAHSRSLSRLHWRRPASCVLRQSAHQHAPLNGWQPGGRRGRLVQRQRNSSPVPSGQIRRCVRLFQSRQTKASP